MGTAFIVSHLDPDLATVRFARYGANYIPRNAPALAVVDDINENVGFWAPQADFRIPQRLSPGFGPLPGPRARADLPRPGRTFVEYQTAVARAGDHAAHPAADLVMIYIEQPDGSGHQFTLTDRAAGAAIRRTRYDRAAGASPPARSARIAAKSRTLPVVPALRVPAGRRKAVEAVLRTVGSRRVRAPGAATSSWCPTTAWRRSTPR